MNKRLIFVGAMLVVSSQIFAQQEKETTIEEVTIASKTPQLLYKSGKNVKLLSEKDLEKYKGQNLNEVLDQVAGFQITGNFNNQTEPKGFKIRGGKNANVMILVDGIPLKDVTGNDYNTADLRLIALENIESIEVLNGASSVLYGSNATVSVINIVTKKSAQKKIEGLLSMRGGSFDTYAQDATFRGKIDNFHYQLNGFNEKSEGQSSASGKDMEKDGWEKQNLSANLGYTAGNFDVNVNSGWNHNFFNYDSGAFADGTPRGNDRQYFVGGNANYQYNKGKIVFNTRYTNTRRLLQDLGKTVYEDNYLYKGDNFFAELFNSYDFNQYLSLTAGVQYEKQSMAYSEKSWGKTALEEVMKFDDTNITNFDVFANANFSYNEFHLTAGTRMTNHSKFKDHWVYSINPYYLKETDNMFYKLGYSYATAFISPTLYQNFGSLPWVLPNFDLKPETNQSHEIDLNIGKKDRSLNFYASLFQRKEKDVFAYKVVDAKTYAGQFMNVDHNKVKGFEVGFDYQLIEQAKIGGNFSFVEKDNAATMLRQPKQRVNSYLEILPFKSTRINLSHQFVSKRADAFYNSTTFKTENVTLDAYHLFNLNVNQKIFENFEAFANIGNLFNKSYVDVVGYTTKPRNYTLGISYKF